MKHTTSRLIALVLAVLLTLPLALFSGVAAMPDDYTYLCQPEDFESYEAGASLVTDDFNGIPPEYSIVEEDGNTFFRMTDTEANDDKALILKCQGNSSMSTKLVLEGSYRYSHKAAADGEGQFVCQLRDIEGGWHTLLRIKAYDGTVSVENPETGGYQFLSYNMNPGEWYHIVSVFDPGEGTVDIYINGSLAGQGLLFGGKNFYLGANQYIACKTGKGSIPTSNPVSMDFDNGCIYEMPDEVSVTVDGEATTMAFGESVDLSKEGFLLTQATVTCNGVTRTTANTQIPVLGDTVITTSYIESGIDYLSYIDFETFETGAPSLTGWFTQTPTAGYEVKEEDGNRFVSMSLGTYNDAFTVNNPATSAENGKLVIEVSYRYHAQTGTSADGADQWICQLRPNWTTLVRIKSHNGDVIVGTGSAVIRLSPDVWNHLTMVVDPAADTITLYVNGAMVAENVKLSSDIQNLTAGQLIIAKVNTSTANGASLDMDNIRLWYAPETVSVTVDGQTSEVPFGQSVNLEREGYLLTKAAVTCNGMTRITTDTSIPAIGDLVIETTYLRTNTDYLNYVDFEAVEPGTPDLSAWFTQTPTAGYEVKSEDGNQYVSMPLGTYDDAFILNNPATSAESGKLVIEVSYRYHSQSNSNAGDWVCQLRPSFTNLVRIKSYNGAVFLCDTNTESFRLAADVWNHLMMVVDPETDTLDIYLNGELMAENQRLGGNTEAGKDIENLSAGQVIIAKVASRNETDVSLDIDNIRFYYAQECTVTVDGSEQKVELGGTVTLEDDVAFAIVTDQNGSSVNTSGSIRILGDTSIITSNNVIYTMPGASIRTGTPTGLRFQTVLHQGAIDALLAAGNVSDIRVGTLIAPTQYVQQAGAFTKEALEAEGFAVPYLDVQATVGEWFATYEGGMYSIAGSIANIKENHYNLRFSGMGYIEITLTSGETITLYSQYSEADHSRSVAEVAAAALADPDNGLTEEQLAQIKVFADAYIAPEGN